MQGPELAPRPLPAAEEVRRALADVLTDPSLERALAPPDHGMLQWLADLVAKLRQVIGDGLDWLTELRLSDPGLFWVLFLVLIGVMLLLLWHVGWTVSQIVRGARGDATPDRSADAARAEHSRALRRRAQAFADRGDYREAVRHGLLALLALVVERRLLAIASSWTLREIATRLAAAAPQLGLRDLTARVEHACYGGGAVTVEDFAAVDGSFERWERTDMRPQAPAPSAP